jgi:hypothetical protein
MGEIELCFLHAYRFLSIRNIIAPTMTIKMIVTIDIGKKYRSAAEAGSDVGSGVGEGASLA